MVFVAIKIGIPLQAPADTSYIVLGSNQKVILILLKVQEDFP
jgi:hypothetical protein